MKKFWILWIILLLGITLIPNLVDRFTPKIKIVEIPYVKIVERIVEKPVYKETQVIEKVVEKIVYQDIRFDIFKIIKEDDNNYLFEIVDTSCINGIWSVESIKKEGRSYLRFTRIRYEYPTVSMSTVGFR